MCYDGAKRDIIRAAIAERLQSINDAPAAQGGGALNLHDREMFKVQLGTLSVLLSIDARLEMLVEVEVARRAREGN